MDFTASGGTMSNEERMAFTPQAKASGFSATNTMNINGNKIT